MSRTPSSVGLAVATVLAAVLVGVGGVLALHPALVLESVPDLRALLESIDPGLVLLALVALFVILAPTLGIAGRLRPSSPTPLARRGSTSATNARGDDLRVPHRQFRGGRDGRDRRRNLDRRPARGGLPRRRRGTVDAAVALAVRPRERRGPARAPARGRDRGTRGVAGGAGCGRLDRFDRRRRGDRGGSRDDRGGVGVTEPSRQARWQAALVAALLACLLAVGLGIPALFFLAIVALGFVLVGQASAPPDAGSLAGAGASAAGADDAESNEETGRAGDAAQPPTRNRPQTPACDSSERSKRPASGRAGPFA